MGYMRPPISKKEKKLKEKQTKEMCRDGGEGLPPYTNPLSVSWVLTNSVLAPADGFSL